MPIFLVTAVWGVDVENIEGACRHCGNAFSVVLADLGQSPVANDYVDPANAPAADPKYGLKVVVCGDCRLAQTIDLKAAEDLFREDYAYFSSHSTAWLDHARRYVDDMTARFGLGEGSTHVELASNDGYLLQFSLKHGLRALGVEPCQSVADAAMEIGVETRVEFFGRDYAKKLVAEGWQADLITANNVFAHVPDVNDFAGGMFELLKPEGVATIEVQHLQRLMERNQFDTIYHEHFSYYSLFAAMKVFATAGLRVFDVEELGTHGGSLRYFVCRESASHAETPNVRRVLDAELAFGMDDDATYRSFAKDVEQVRTDLRAMLLPLKAAGKKIAAYGAPAKGATLLNFCDIGPETIDFTVDKAPSKQNKLIPGIRLPILPPEAIAEQKPDYLLILPWNLKDEVVAQVSATCDWEMDFITAIPTPTIFKGSSLQEKAA
jgi:SAM-dependent methyltransferase